MQWLEAAFVVVTPSIHLIGQCLLVMLRSWSLCAGAGAAGGAAAGGSSYLNLGQHSHQNTDTSLEALYGDTAVWINHHQGGGSYGGRSGAARMWRSGFSGRRR